MIVKVQWNPIIHKMEKSNVIIKIYFYFGFAFFCFLTNIKCNAYELVFVGVWTGTCVGFDDGGKVDCTLSNGGKVVQRDVLEGANSAYFALI